MVDEYQDTNKVQYRWLQLLTSEHRNLAVVGDDAQSIYSFRAADIRNILEFEEDYPDAHVVKLEQNYRSTQTILDAANALIAHNRGQMPKHLWTDLGEGDPVRVREMADEYAEARWVTAEIQRLVDEGVSRAEIAVFYRTNAQSRVLDEMLTRAGVGYQVIGGPKFYDRAEVKDAVGYLAFLTNPKDATAFTRIANSPRRGIGQTSLSRVLGYANDTGISVWEAAEGDVPNLTKAAKNAIGRFMDTMNSLKERADQNGPVAQLLDAVLHESGYLDALHAERTIEAQGRVENLQELVSAAAQYDINAENGSLGEFLQQTSLFADADNIREDEGLVTLMTMHNAKGLEFPIVFMIGMEDGTFPHSRSIEESNLDEERRLAYVGVTRAMRQLTLTYARRRTGYGGGAAPTIKSRFLDEIPRELTDQPARVQRGYPAPGRVASWSQAAAASAEYAGANTSDAATLQGRRRHPPRQARRGSRDRRAARRHRRGAVRGRAPRPLAVGRFRPDPQALASYPAAQSAATARHAGRRSLSPIPASSGSRSAGGPPATSRASASATWTARVGSSLRSGARSGR